MPRYLNTAEVAALLRRSEPEVRRLTRAGLLPGRQLRPRGRLLFDERDLEAALVPAGKRKRKPGADEPAEAAAQS